MLLFLFFPTVIAVQAYKSRLGMVVHTYHPCTGKAEAGGKGELQAQGQPGKDPVLQDKKDPGTWLTVGEHSFHVNSAPCKRLGSATQASNPSAEKGEK